MAPPKTEPGNGNSDGEQPQDGVRNDEQADQGQPPAPPIQAPANAPAVDVNRSPFISPEAVIGTDTEAAHARAREILSKPANMQKACALIGPQVTPEHIVGAGVRGDHLVIVTPIGEKIPLPLSEFA